MRDLKPEIIIAHFDGHGVVAAVLAARKYNAPRENILIQFPITGPGDFHKLPDFFDGRILYSATSYLFLDIAANIKDPKMFTDTFHKIYHNSKRLNQSFVKMTYIDHHETTLEFLDAFPGFVRFVFVPSALKLNQLFVESKRDEVLAILGAVSDRDKSVLESELFVNNAERFLKLAAGLDVMVRRDIDEAVNVLFKGDFETLKRAANEIPEPKYDNAEEFDTVILYNEQLTENWGPKQLELLASRYNKEFAVGYEYVSREDQWIVRAITFWLSNAEPVKNFIETNRTVIGHPAAPSIAAVDERDAQKLAREIAEKINKKYAIQRGKGEIVLDTEIRDVLAGL